MTTSMATRTDYEEGCPIPLSTLGRLYRGDEQALVATLRTLSERQRAQLALFCNGRQHLRELGLRIAASCEEETLTRIAGAAGTVLSLQARSSKQNAASAAVQPLAHQRKVSLARLSCMS